MSTAPHVADICRSLRKETPEGLRKLERDTERSIKEAGNAAERAAYQRIADAVEQEKRRRRSTPPRKGA
jgi:hypothetical protein